MVDLSLTVSVIGFFGDVSFTACGVAVVIVVVVAVIVVVVSLVVVVAVSNGLACFIVECDFALLVTLGLSSVATGRC